MSSRNIGPSLGRVEAKANNGPSGVAMGVNSVAMNRAGSSLGPVPGAIETSLLPGGGQMPLTEQDLPPPNTKRWVMRRKAEVVAGVRCGLISLDEACRRYTLSVEEFLSWQRLIDSHGVRGLRATRLQDYRAGSGGRDGDGDTGLVD
jgi:hypothetical protein